jgi:hypothetical protein
MPSSSIVPGIDRDVYLVLDDFGRMGGARRQTNTEGAELDGSSIIARGPVQHPVRIIAFNVVCDVLETSLGNRPALRG